MNHEPLEIKNAILKDLNLQLIADEKGRRFPHPGIEVQLLAPTDADKNKYQMMFGENSLQHEIHNFLQPPRCLKATPFVEISFIEVTEDELLQKNGFLLRYVAKATMADTDVYLEVLDGYANRRKIKLIYNETYIGRCQKVVNKHGRIERVNDLYFPDVRELKGNVPIDLKNAETINNSVSRLHARIKSIGGNYFLFDDGSIKGTAILLNGRGKSEPVDGFSGKRLGDDDVISFGKATVRVRIVKKN